jgi:hypothetical protein
MPATGLRTTLTWALSILPPPVAMTRVDPLLTPSTTPVPTMVATLASRVDHAIATLLSTALSR